MSRCRSVVALAFTALLLSACGPSAQQKAKWAEDQRIQCLDKLCYGDVAPKVDSIKNALLKLNGQWYVGPKEYFSSGINGAYFFWWMGEPQSSATLPSKQMQALLNDGKAAEFSIEIFLQGKSETLVASTMFQTLLQEEKQGKVFEKRNLKAGLDTWKTRSGTSEETWFIATRLKDPSGDPPVIYCRNTHTNDGRCSGGFMWRPDIGATMRFSATHGSDWPEIYLETTRVLALLKKV